MSLALIKSTISKKQSDNDPRLLKIEAKFDNWVSVFNLSGCSL